MKKKKVLALLLAAVMVLGLAACGNKETKKETQTSTPASETKKETSESVAASESSEVKVEPKDPVTLEWYYGGIGVQRDTEAVQNAFNELLQTYEGMEHVSVHLNTSINKEYANAVALAQSAGQQIDIIQTYKLDFAEQVSNGTFMPMNDMLEDYPDLKNELAQWVWDLGSVDGNIYIVPCYQRATNLMYFIAPKEYVDNYGDAEEFRRVLGDVNSTPEDYAALLEAWIEKVQAGEGDTKYLYPLGTFYNTTSDANRGLSEPFDVIASSFIMEADKNVVENVYTRDDAKKAYEITADWAEKGYIYPDIISLTDSSAYEKANMMNDTAYIYYLQNGIGDEAQMSAQTSAAYGFDVYAFPLGDPAHITNTWAAGGNGIYTKSEHPEEAMRLLELLNTEEGAELYNLLCWGLEGTHYEKIDDTHIKTLEFDSEEGSATTSYATKKWLLGNTKYAWLNQGTSEEMKAMGEALNEDPTTQISQLMGFIADTSNVEDQIAQVKAVISEYRKQLAVGANGSDWESVYNDFVKALEVAGYNDIITELQGQVDAFLK